jgi:hypothetical protein
MKLDFMHLSHWNLNAENKQDGQLYLSIALTTLSITKNL